jgi:hypothetical protein
MSDEPPRTKRVVRTERRQRPLRAGIVASVAGLGAIVGGAVMFSAVQASQVLSPIADADVGDTLTFEADGGSYALVLKRGEISDENVVSRLVSDTTCTVVASDATTRTVDGSRQFSSSQTDFGASIGTFSAPKGTTKVTCVGEGSRLAFDRYAVAPERTTAQIIAFVILGVGLLAAAAGAWLIVVGLRGRSIVERVPV